MRMRTSTITLLLLLFTSLHCVSQESETIFEKRKRLSEQAKQNSTLHSLRNAGPQRVAAVDANQAVIEDLIINHFLGGGCIDVRNITSQSFEEDNKYVQIGRFEESLNLHIGLEKGIILSSGMVVEAEGPNPGEVYPSTGFGEPGDPDIPNSNDAAVIEFEFMPTGSTIEFNYVFASEEYPDFVCQFNDAFKFLIKKVGTTDPLENIALIPGTTYPVTINNVNDKYNGGNNCVPEDFSQFYIANPTGSTSHSYGGSTTVFTAQANVDACEWYYFKMVIADVGVDDSIYDSAVFLEANSFSDDSNTGIDPQGSMGNTQNGVEGCSDAGISFTRKSDFMINQPIVIEFTLTGTATEGVDYANVPNTITLPANETEVFLPIDVFLDSDDEPTETIIVSTVNTPEFTCGCSTTSQTGTLEILDYSDPIENIEESFCEGGSITLPDGTVVNTPGDHEIFIPRKNFPACDSIVNYVITEVQNPETQKTTISQTDCNNQGEAYFNLVAHEDDFITDTRPNLEVHYFEDAGLTTEITTPDNYFSGSASVYVQVTANQNSAACETIQEIILNVIPGGASFTLELSTCETEFESAEAIFDLSTLIDDINGGDSSVQVSFHQTEADANSTTPGGDNPIQDVENYLSAAGTIYARAESTDPNGNACFVVGSVDLLVLVKPTLVSNHTISSCEVGNDEASFTFESVDAFLQSGESVAFYASEQDAQSQSNAITPPYQSNAKQIWVRTMNANCFTIGTINLDVIQEPTAPYLTIESCQQNGIVTYDLALLKVDIESDGNHTAQFYPTQTDAQNATAEITNLNYQTESESVFVLISNTANGCTNIEKISLQPTPMVVNDLGLAVLCTGDPFELPNGEIVTEPGVYERTFFNPETNCDESFVITINPMEIKFPNSFSPNADGVNDEFIPMPNRNCQLPIEDYNLKVFNRWGELVFESNSVTKGWNGQLDDRRGMAGTYIWMANYTYEGEKVKQQGSVYLLH